MYMCISDNLVCGGGGGGRVRTYLHPFIYKHFISHRLNIILYQVTFFNFYHRAEEVGIKYYGIIADTRIK